ncbi:MAG TPA: hypothetical protein VMA53_06935 [Stellaceae bacterium]|nr:hypothetical protein [Stellaceae bacterium]
MLRKSAAAGLLGLALVGLCSCASPQELRAQDEAACTGYGFQPGTPQFAGCLQRESLARNYGAAPAVGFGMGFGFGY